MKGVRITFEPISLDLANECLRSWGHKMGELQRPYQSHAHALIDDGHLQAVVTHSTLIRDHVGGGLDHLTRANTIELSRLCAHRPGLCRVALRLWREFVFPNLDQDLAISYQDADLHNGNTYRFDGWQRVAFSRAGGTDQRTGRKGRDKWVWLWRQPAPHPTQPVKRRYQQELMDL
jgi:hypothetical protein